MKREISTKAHEFAVWRAGTSVDWFCTAADIAAEVGLSTRGVEYILKRKGWKCREEQYKGAEKRTGTRKDLLTLFESRRVWE